MKGFLSSLIINFVLLFSASIGIYGFLKHGSIFGLCGFCIALASIITFNKHTEIK